MGPNLLVQVVGRIVEPRTLGKGSAGLYLHSGRSGVTRIDVGFGWATPLSLMVQGCGANWEACFAIYVPLCKRTGFLHTSSSVERCILKGSLMLFISFRPKPWNQRPGETCPTMGLSMLTMHVITRSH